MSNPGQRATITCTWSYILSSRYTGGLCKLVLSMLRTSLISSAWMTIFNNLCFSYFVIVLDINYELIMLWKNDNIQYFYYNRLRQTFWVSWSTSRPAGRKCGRATSTWSSWSRHNSWTPSWRRSTSTRIWSLDCGSELSWPRQSLESHSPYRRRRGKTWQVRLSGVIQIIHDTRRGEGVRQYVTPTFFAFWNCF